MLRLIASCRPLTVFTALVFVAALLPWPGPARSQDLEAAESAADPQAAYRAVADEFDRLYAGVERVAEATDASRFEIDALAERLGSDPAVLLAFIQRDIRFEPYLGSLRGARGALASGAANALDRSLLLAALLQRAGFTVEIASARLDERLGQRLLKRVGEPAPVRPDPLTVDAALVQSLERTMGIDVETLIAAADQVERHGETVADELDRRIAEDAAFLTDRLSAAGVAMAEPVALAALAPAVAEHFWVRYRDPEGAWIDLDPSFPEFAPGEAVGPPQSSFAPDEVPDGLVHRLGIRVVLRTAEGGAEQDHVLIDERFAVSDLQGVAITLGNQPLPSPYAALLAGQPIEAALAGVDEFVTALTVGSRAYVGSFFDARGNLYANPPGSDAGNAERLAQPTGEGFGGAANALEGLFGSAPPTASASADRRIVEQWVEYELVSPTVGGDRSTRTERRTVYAAPAAAAETPSDAEIVQDLFWSVDLLPMAGPVAVDHLGHLQLRSMLDGRADAMNALRRAFGLPVDVQATAGATAQPIPPLLLATGVTEGLASVMGDRFPTLVAVWDRPQLIGFETDLVRRPDRPPGLVQGYDIVALDPQVIARGPAADATGAGFAATLGALATALEWSLTTHRLDLLTELPVPAVANTGTVFRAARTQDVEIVTIRPDDDRAAALARLNVPPGEEVRIAAALDRGQVVIAPAMPVAVAGADEPWFGWWRADPATGEVIGVMQGGRGAAMAEYENLFLVAEWFGTMLTCGAGIERAFGNDVVPVAMCLITSVAVPVGAAGSVRGHVTAGVAIVATLILIFYQRYATPSPPRYMPVEPGR